MRHNSIILTEQRKRGAIAVLSAVMMVLILGVAAITMDLLVISIAWCQLQTAADAGALAGAHELIDEERFDQNCNMSTLVRNSHDRAKKFAQINQVLGQIPVISDNTSNDSTGHIVIGEMVNGSLQASCFNTSEYNSVKVKLARSSEQGGTITTFFARLLGINQVSVSYQAVATAGLYEVAGFRSESGLNSDLLPIVLDEDSYDEMIDPTQGNTIDEYAYNPTTGEVTSGPDGIEESQLYPVRNGMPGNWGTVKIGVSNNSTKTLGDQIRYGVTPEQLSNYPSGTLELDQIDSDQEPYTLLGGNPGISAGIKDDLKAIIGEARTIPIYEPPDDNDDGKSKKKRSKDRRQRQQRPIQNCPIRTDPSSLCQFQRQSEIRHRTASHHQ